MKTFLICLFYISVILKNGMAVTFDKLPIFEGPYGDHVMVVEHIGEHPNRIRIEHKFQIDDVREVRWYPKRTEQPASQPTGKTDAELCWECHNKHPPHEECPSGQVAGG